MTIARGIKTNGRARGQKIIFYFFIFLIMIRLLLLLCLTIALISWCAVQKPKEAERVTIKSVGTCRQTYCEVVLENWMEGKVDKYFSVTGNPIRTDLVK